MVNRIDFKHRVPCVAACFITAFQLIPNDTFGGRRRGKGRRDSTRAKNWKQCTENTYTSSFVYRKKMSFSGKNNRQMCGTVAELLRIATCFAWENDFSLFSFFFFEARYFLFKSDKVFIVLSFPWNFFFWIIRHFLLLN